ncbi:arylsulfatase B-like [Epargyreus clarus]|uniref:arylsulfatase B-like n=1 Tax=Epargyreus clarus TaxID=520877 RepID=UPI003C2FC20F
MKPRVYLYGMVIIILIIIIITVVLYNKTTIIKSERPNIVVIIADDMGRDDVSYHGSDQIMTPNIDLLAYSGVALERYYTHCVCTPSRSALYTGKFAHTLGMQGFPLTNGEDRGIPLKEKLLPQYLKSLGYATHLVGKWHVGHSRKAFLPTFRGFDTHFGHRLGYIDYYEYFVDIMTAFGDLSGLDLHRNLDADWTSNKYVTDLYTEEALSVIKSHNLEVPLFLTVAHNAPHAGNRGATLQAPPEDVRAMRHVASAQRRIYAAMVKKLDDSVGDIVKALYDKRILDNTLIVFVSDNGGMTTGDFMNYASNWPLRGIKMTPFEGGIRVNGLLWSQNLTNSNNHVWDGYMHAVDWVPTLLKAAGAEPPSAIDGLDLWENITSNTDSKRDVMFEIDDYNGFASIIAGDFKLVTGNVPQNMANHQGENLRGIIGRAPSYVDTLKNSKVYTTLEEIGIKIPLEDNVIRNRTKISCNKDTKKDICYPDKVKGKLCLFNIKEDPCETRDISQTYPQVAEDMNTRLQAEIQRMIPRQVPFSYDSRAHPSLHNFTWTTWADEI